MRRPEAVLLAIGLAACGGADSSVSSSPEAGGSQPAAPTVGAPDPRSTPGDVTPSAGDTADWSSTATCKAPETDEFHHQRATVPLRTPDWVWWGVGVAHLGGLAGDPRGNAYVLFSSTPGAGASLDRVVNGYLAPMRNFPITGQNPLANVFGRSPNLLHGPGDALYVGVTGFVGFGDVTYVDLGAGPRTGAQTAELRDDGSFVRTVLSCCSEYFESTQWIEDVDEQGNTLFGEWTTTRSTTRLRRADGPEIVLSSFDRNTCETTGLQTGCDSPRFTPDGSIVCGGRAIVKLDLEGSVVWTSEISSAKPLATHVGVTRDGRIVAAGPSCSLLDSHSGVVAALAPDGTVLWVREIAPAPQALALASDGRAAMLLSEDWRLLGTMGKAEVLVLDREGEVEWRSAIGAAERISFAGDQVVVAGTVAPGVHDLGRGAVRVETQSIFVAGFDR
jgi:hypothetical protein